MFCAFHRLHSFAKFGVGTNDAGLSRALSSIIPDPTTHELIGVYHGKGSITEGRSSSIWLPDHENLVREFKSGEPSIEGGRIVRNLFAGSTGTFSTETVTVVVGHEYRVSMEGTGSITVSGAASDTITGASGQRKCSDVLTATTTSLVCTVSGTVTNAQCEDVTGQSNQNPGEYVSVGGSSHGLDIDGVAVFANENGNTVDAGVITEAIGSALDPLPRLVHAPAATNLVTYSRDLTDSSWTATNVTVAKDYDGIDGVPNNSCTLTATSGNGTVINDAVTAASGEHATAWYIKRKTGTGNIELTVDNGSTWQDVTGQVDSGWTRISVDQSALTNPRVGIRIVTNADAVYVANAECYANTSKEVAENLPPIFTSGSSASRAACDVSFTRSGNVDEIEGMLIVKEWLPTFAYDGVPSNSNHGVVSIRDHVTSLLGIRRTTPGTQGNLRSYDGTTNNLLVFDWAADTSYTLAVRWSTRKSKFQVGFRELPSGSWTWGTDTAFDGAFDTGNNINLFYESDYSQSIRSICMYAKDKGTDWIENHF